MLLKYVLENFFLLVQQATNTIWQKEYDIENMTHAQTIY